MQKSNRKTITQKSKISRGIYGTSTYGTSYNNLNKSSTSLRDEDATLGWGKPGFVILIRGKKMQNKANVKMGNMA